MTYCPDLRTLGIAAVGFLAASTAVQASSFSQKVVPWGSVVQTVEARSSLIVPKPAIPRAMKVAEKTVKAPEAKAAAKTEEVAPVEELPENPDGRYNLLSVNGDVLRLDKESGTVSFCAKANGSWRCLPAPLAEEAYLQEIEELSNEVDRLQERIDELEAAAAAAAPVTIAPQTTEPLSGETATVEQKADEQAPTEDDASTVAPSAKEEPAQKFAEEEKELEEMLQFTESAMRRFFGLMQDLKSELDGSSSN